MDKMVFVALNTMRNLRVDQTNNAQNLANANVPGYRRDLPATRDSAFLEALDQYRSRVLTQVSDVTTFASEPGALRQTGETMDLALRAEGWFFVQPPSGETALSRRGDLGLDAERRLVDGAGNLLLGNDLEPIEVPAFREFVVDERGGIFIEPFDAPAGTRLQIGVLGTTLAEGATLAKFADGQIRPLNSELPEPDQRARITQGMLEASNVDTIGALIANLEGQRQFELSVKLISEAQKIDEAGTRIMSMPNG